MKMRLLKTEAEYNTALQRLEVIFDAIPGTPEFDEAEFLIALIEIYEKEHYPILPPDPVEAVKFRMEQMNLKQTDLVKFFGTRARVSEFMNRKRPLSLSQIKRLYKEFGIPAEVLLG